MSIDWDRIERGQPTADDIKAAVQKAKDLPAAGDAGHVQAMFAVYGKGLPSIDPSAWDDAKLKKVKLKKLQATNAQLNRENLIWHLKNPGKSRMQSARNSHPQVLKDKAGNLAIVDGHHRLSALRMLGLKKELCWVVKEGNLP